LKIHNVDPVISVL